MRRIGLKVSTVSPNGRGLTECALTPPSFVTAFPIRRSQAGESAQFFVIHDLPVDNQTTAAFACEPSVMESHLERIIRMQGLLAFRHLRLDGELSDLGLYREIAAHRVVRVVRGVYMAMQDWQALTFDERLLARTLAIARHRGKRYVFSHLSAAVLWGLPLYVVSGEEPAHALALPSWHRRSSREMRWHQTSDLEDGVETMLGLQVTGITRTIRDVARWSCAEVSIGCADAGLRLLTGATRALVPPECGRWKEEQLEWLAAHRGERGVHRAAKVLAIADPRADSVAESASRLQFHRLGIPVAIQVRVQGLDWREYWLDFEFLGQQAFGEMDGRGKYAMAEQRRKGGAYDAVLQEKQREDEVRGVTGKRCVRWGFDVTGNPRRLAERLSQMGIDTRRQSATPSGAEIMSFP